MRETNSESGLTVLNTDRIENKRHTQIAVGVNWVYTIFAVLLIAAGGFGYGFFYLLNQNSRLIETEWLYRRERTLYKSEKELQLLLNHEKDFFTGTSHEQDSIKDVIRYWEQKGDFDKTYLYFSPAED